MPPHVWPVNEPKEPYEFKPSISKATVSTASWFGCWRHRGVAKTNGGAVEHFPTPSSALLVERGAKASAELLGFSADGQQTAGMERSIRGRTHWRPPLKKKRTSIINVKCPPPPLVVISPDRTKRARVSLTSAACSNVYDPFFIHLCPGSGSESSIDFAST